MRDAKLQKDNVKVRGLKCSFKHGIYQAVNQRK